MGNKVQVVLVGHCAADVWSLKIVVEQAVPGVAVQSVNDMNAIDNLDLAGCLLLVNRTLPRAFPISDGVELIRKLKQRSPAPAAMLISNFPEAQAQAEEAGALPGFGKAELHTDKAKVRLRTALGV